MSNLRVKDGGGADVYLAKTGAGTNADPYLDLAPPGMATAANQTAGNAALGTAADAETSGDGSIIAVLKRLRTLLAGTLTVTTANRTLLTVTGTRTTTGDGPAVIAAPGAGVKLVLVNVEVNTTSAATTTLLLKSAATAKRTWTLGPYSLYANDYPRGHELRMGTNEAVYLNLDAASPTNYSIDYFVE